MQLEGQEYHDVLKATNAVLSNLLAVPNIKNATKFLTPKRTVRGTVIGKPRKNEGRVCVSLSIGVPNYRERKFIKDCQQAGEPFPVAKVQLKLRPEKSKK